MAAWGCPRCLRRWPAVATCSAGKSVPQISRTARAACKRPNPPSVGPQSRVALVPAGTARPARHGRSAVSLAAAKARTPRHVRASCFNSRATLRRARRCSALVVFVCLLRAFAGAAGRVAPPCWTRRTCRGLRLRRTETRSTHGSAVGSGTMRFLNWAGSRRWAGLKGISRSHSGDAVSFCCSMCACTWGGCVRMCVCARARARLGRDRGRWMVWMLQQR